MGQTGQAVTQQQNKFEDWSRFWSGRTVEDEIRMGDFFGGRQWIAKFAPRQGRVLEAGCGLGRIVFYLSCLGIEIEGLDWHRPTVDHLQAWRHDIGLGCTFRVGDVASLPYADASLSGYISLGVIEHFQEGPARALAEAYRVLRPGGVAIITTPSLSVVRRAFPLYDVLRRTIRRLRGRDATPKPFFQYWYGPRTLARFIRQSGLRVTQCRGGDLVYLAYEARLRKKALLQAVSLLESTILSRLGAQSFTISIKEADRMHCFFCGECRAARDSLESYAVPVCGACERLTISAHYRLRSPTVFHNRYAFDPRPLAEARTDCHHCGASFDRDPLFGDFGFDVPTCNLCLANPQINLVLSNEHTRPIWRATG